MKNKAPRIPKQPKAPKQKKPALTERQLVERQAEKMLRDLSRLKNTQGKSSDQKDFTEGVDVWKDADFFFSVVFQSAKQKVLFLEFLKSKIGISFETEPNSPFQIQIINGLKLAEKMGCPLPIVTPTDYVYPDLALKAVVLDNENF